MKVLLIPIVMLLSSVNASTVEGHENGLISVTSQFSVKDTTRRLVNILTNKKMTIFNQIEHDKNAEKVGLTLPETNLIIFGNPKMGSKLMQCAPSVAIDLPMKFLISKNTEGQVVIQYNSPSYLVERHQIEGCDVLIAKMSGALAKISGHAANKS